MLHELGSAQDCRSGFFSIALIEQKNSNFHCFMVKFNTFVDSGGLSLPSFGRAEHCMSKAFSAMSNFAHNDCICTCHLKKLEWALLPTKISQAYKFIFQIFMLPRRRRIPSLPTRST
jgi:hypothetical protein